MKFDTLKYYRQNQFVVTEVVSTDASIELQKHKSLGAGYLLFRPSLNCFPQLVNSHSFLASFRQLAI